MNLSKPDLVDALAAARPTDNDLASSWPAEHRAELWVRIGEDSSPENAGGRRIHPTAWLVAAAGVVAFSSVPTIMSSGDAAARSELLKLASVAAESDAPVIAPGTYLHVKTESRQENNNPFSGERFDTDREQWIRWNGAKWAIDTRPSVGWTEYHQFGPPVDVDYVSPTPEFIADLPDGSNALRGYLDDTVSGSNSHEEAIFVAISDLANSRMLDPATLGIALEVLAGLGGVETRDVVVNDRDAVEINYDQHFGIGLLGRRSFTVDRETAQVLRVSDSDPGGTYQSETTLIEVVDTIPDNVLAQYERYENGARVCANGLEATGDGICP